jgi:hypothetical protein
VLAVVNGVVELGRVGLLLECSAVGNAIEDTAEQGGITGDLR